MATELFGRQAGEEEARGRRPLAQSARRRTIFKDATAPLAAGDHEEHEALADCRQRQRRPALGVDTRARHDCYRQSFGYEGQLLQEGEVVAIVEDGLVGSTQRLPITPSRHLVGGERAAEAMLGQRVDDKHDALGSGAFGRQRPVDHRLGAASDDLVRRPGGEYLPETANGFPIGKQLEPGGVRVAERMLGTDGVQPAHVVVAELGRHDEHAMMASKDLADENVADLVQGCPGRADESDTLLDAHYGCGGRHRHVSAVSVSAASRSRAGSPRPSAPPPSTDNPRRCA